MKKIEDILKLCGFPERYVVLDFESYFKKPEYSLFSLSAWQYITDDRFELTGLGAQQSGKDRGPLFFTPSIPVGKFEPAITLGLRKLQANAGDDLRGVTVVLKHARFDATLLAVKFDIHPKYMIDIEDLARHLNSHGSHKLSDMCKEHGLKDKGDTMQFEGKHWNTMSDEERESLKEYTLNDCAREMELFELLLPRLTNPEMELAIANHTIKLYTRPTLAFDFKQADILLVQMQEKLDATVAATGFTHDELSGDKSFMAILEAALPEGEHVPMKAGKKAMIPCFAKTDVEYQQLIVHADARVRQLVGARSSVGSWPTHIARVNRMIAMATAAGGFLPVPLVFYGAHTGRFSGADKINLQNLGGRGRAGQGNDPLIGKIRSLLLAPDGCDLVVADSAQIEARILAWLAGQDDLVQAFAEHKDIYSKFATTLFQAKVRKPTKIDPAPLARLYSIRRGFGKDGILGCGYGMGGTKFHSRCLENPDLEPLFTSGEYDFAFIDGLVKTYRSAYPKIPAFWQTIERLFRMVVILPNEVVKYGELLTLWNDRGTVNIKLPSGRVLFYDHASFNKSTRELRYHYGKLWGGTLTENIVQAIARDLLVFWILKCEESSTPVCHHVHDEVISIQSSIRAGDVLVQMIEIMRTVPDWAKGCPVDAEGGICHEYTK